MRMSHVKETIFETISTLQRIDILWEADSTSVFLVVSKECACTH